MALEAWEFDARQKGNKAGADVAHALRINYGDIPFARTSTLKFTDEQREALTARGLVVYELTGQSIASQRVRGSRFWTDWHKSYPKFEALTSRLSEVAFNPDPEKFFLPKSNNKTLSQQEELVGEFSQRLQKDVKGIGAIIGDAPDYVELTFGYKGEHGSLFGERYGFRYTRTRTSVGSVVACVGDFGPDSGLGVRGWNPAGGRGSVWAAPLVVPAEIK